jgi:hypothetical protein
MKNHRTDWMDVCVFLTVVFISILFVAIFVSMIKEQNLRREVFGKKFELVKYKAKIGFVMEENKQRDGEDSVDYYKRCKRILEGMESKATHDKKEYVVQVENDKKSETGVLFSYVVNLKYRCDDFPGKTRKTLIAVALNKEQVRRMFIDSVDFNVYDIQSIELIKEPVLK